MALWDNIQGKWKLANTTYTDDSGNGYTLTAYNTPTVAIGHGGGTNLATQFTRSSSVYCSITDASAPNLSITGNITISCWVYLTTLTSGQYYLFVSKLDSSGQYSYDLFTEGTGKQLTCRLSNNGTALTSCVGATVLAINTWYHVVAVYDGTDIRIYLNGALDSNGASNPVAYTSGIYNSTSAFRIGSGNAANYMNGRIDDVAVWSRALSSSEVSVVYSLPDDFYTAFVAGIIRDRQGSIVDCGVYPIRVNVYPVNNTVTAPIASALITSSNGVWSIYSGGITSIKYIVTFEFEGVHIPSNDRNVAGAEFMLGTVV